MNPFEMQLKRKPTCHFYEIWKFDYHLSTFWKLFSCFLQTFLQSGVTGVTRQAPGPHLHDRLALALMVRCPSNYQPNLLRRRLGHSDDILVLFCSGNRSYYSFFTRNIPWLQRYVIISIKLTLTNSNSCNSTFVQIRTKFSSPLQIP